MPKKKAPVPNLVPQAQGIYRGLIAAAWATMRARFPGLSLTPIKVLADPALWTAEDKSMILESRAISQDVPAFTVQIPVTWAGRWVLGEIALADTSEFTATEALAVAEAARSHPFLLAQDLDDGFVARLADAIQAAIPIPQESEDVE